MTLFGVTLVALLDVLCGAVLTQHLGDAPDVRVFTALDRYTIALLSSTFGTKPSAIERSDSLPIKY